MELGVPAQMRLVDYRMLPRDGAPAGLALPIEVRIDDDRFGDEWRAVAVVESGVVTTLELVAEHRRVPFQIAKMPARIGVQHELVGIEAVPVVGLVGAVDAVPVNRPGADTRYIGVPDLVGKFGQLDT